MKPWPLLCVVILACACAKKPDPVWSEVPLEGADTSRLRVGQLSVLASDDIWGITRPDVFRYDGKSWRHAGSPNAEHLVVVGKDDVWGVGRGGWWFHWDGKEWKNGQVAEVAAKYRDFWGVIAVKDEIWATAKLGPGEYSRFKDGTWSEVVVPELAGWELERLSNIGGHVYVALMHGERIDGKYTAKAAVGHFDGERWEVLDYPPGFHIAGTAADDVWLVYGRSPKHFDGTKWTDTQLPEGVEIYDLFSRSKTEAYAVGKNGSAAKWDGAKWTVLPTGTRHDLLTVSGGPEGPVWAGGMRGKMLRYPATR